MSKRAVLEFRIHLEESGRSQYSSTLTLDTEALDALIKRSRGRGGSDWHPAMMHCCYALERALLEWAREQFPHADSDVDALSIGHMNVQNLRRRETVAEHRAQLASEGYPLAHLTLPELWALEAKGDAAAVAELKRRDEVYSNLGQG